MSEGICVASCHGTTRDDELEFLRRRCSDLEEELALANGSSSHKRWTSTLDFTDMGVDVMIPLSEFEGMCIRITVEGLYPCRKA